MTEIKISKVKLIKGENLELSYIKTESDKSKTEVSEKHKTPVHPDLKRSFSSLAIHIAVIAGFVEPKQIKDIKNVDAKLTEAFHVTGYSIGGDEDQEGVVLTGHKILKNGKALIMNTPFSRFNEAPETRYQFMDELQSSLGDLEKEVKAYLDGSKKGEDLQGSLFDDEDDDEDGDKVTHMQVAGSKTSEDKEQEMLGNLKSSKGHISQANPEAMESLKNWDNPNKVIDNTVNEMVQDQREHLRGKRNGQGKGNGKGKASAKA